MRKRMYIQAARALSAQDGFIDNALPAEVRQPMDNACYFPSVDYSRWFSIMQLRRMSRLTRAGMAVAIETLRDAGIEKPDAIITGTGKGSLGDTEKFMESVRLYEEGTLNPSPFIQSTYNALNGLMGLHHQVDCYNTTYVHRGFSLEHALQDAQLLFHEGRAAHILAGSFEEMTPEHFGIKKKLGYWKTEPVTANHLFESNTTGTIAGEGCFFFALEKQPTDKTLAALSDLRLLFEPSRTEVEASINAILREANLQPSDINMIITGRNGDLRHDHYYNQVSALFPSAAEVGFKHLSGEFDTAAGFALWLASKIIATQQTPPATLYAGVPCAEVKNLLIYNNYYGVEHAVYLLEKVS
ncbi:MAG: beta-ketoacyl synthase chain length factor [Flavihumibacter sp.]